jgi:hypothetical protein
MYGYKRPTIGNTSSFFQRLFCRGKDLVFDDLGPSQRGFLPERIVREQAPESK